MSKSLNQFVKDNSKYLRLKDGESFTGKFIEFKVAVSNFDPDKEIVIYKFEIEGKEKFWQSGSTAVADAFASVKEGDAIQVKRSGSGSNTKYSIKAGEIDQDAPEADENVPF